MIGGVVNDKAIVRIRAIWLDGSQSIFPVENGAFLLVRSDEVGLAWSIGLDTSGAVVKGSLAYDETVDISPLDYGATRQVSIGGGMIVMGAYSQTVPIAKECVQLLYFTADNAKLAISGKAYLPQSTACTEPVGKILGPSTGTVVDGSTIIGGRVLDQTVTQVRIHWSDGLDQIISVVDGFYLVQRSGSSATVVSFIGLDANGNVLTP